MLTGEGCFDSLSLHGKVVRGVARRCKEAGVPVIAIVGTMDEALVDVGRMMGVTHFAPVRPSDTPLADLVRRPRSRMTATVARVASALHDGVALPALIEPTDND